MLRRAFHGDDVTLRTVANAGVAVGWGGQWRRDAGGRRVEVSKKHWTSLGPWR